MNQFDSINPGFRYFNLIFFDLYKLPQNQSNPILFEKLNGINIYCYLPEKIEGVNVETLTQKGGFYENKNNRIIILDVGFDSIINSDPENIGEKK